MKKENKIVRLANAKSLTKGGGDKQKEKHTAGKFKHIK